MDITNLTNLFIESAKFGKADAHHISVDQDVLAITTGFGEQDAELAERFAACVDFCSGIPTAMLVAANHPSMGGLAGLSSSFADLSSQLRVVESQLSESRNNDRSAMLYLSEIKVAAHHFGDFPSLVQHIKSAFSTKQDEVPA